MKTEQIFPEIKMEWKHRAGQEVKVTVMLDSGHKNRVGQSSRSYSALSKTSKIQTGKRDQSQLRCVKWVKQGLSPFSF